jgi:DNA polymerase-3 subunit epsilon
MSRQIVLDTETTGLSAEGGDRIIEIGCVELLNRKLTGNNLHFYLNPERDSHEDALKVHGISNEFLRDKPKFAEVAQEFLRLREGAEIIIHNAAFDVGFLEQGARADQQSARSPRLSGPSRTPWPWPRNVSWQAQQSGRPV